MRQTAYLVMDKSDEPQFVETDERNAQVFAGALGYTVTETFYDLPDPDTWERIEEEALLTPRSYLAARGLSAADGERVRVMCADLIDRCKRLAGAE